MFWLVRLATESASFEPQGLDFPTWKWGALLPLLWAHLATGFHLASSNMPHTLFTSLSLLMSFLLPGTIPHCLPPHPSSPLPTRPMPTSPSRFRSLIHFPQEIVYNSAGCQTHSSPMALSGVYPILVEAFWSLCSGPEPSKASQMLSKDLKM